MGAREGSKVCGLFLLGLLTLAAGCGDNTPAFRFRPFHDGGPIETDGALDGGAPIDAPATDGNAGDALDGRDAGDAPSPTDLRDATDTNRTEVTGADADGGDAPSPTDAANASDAANAIDASNASDRSDAANTSDASSGTDGGDAAPPPAPTCSITAPELDVTHPMLNGVPAAQGGDRASAVGAPYEVAFEVTTSLADNQLVVLTVDDVAAPAATSLYMAQVSGGRARFPGVALPVDGFYEARARCLGTDGLVGLSTTATYQVDTTPPVFDLTSPHSGDFIPPSGLTDGTFPVCGGTSSADAVNLDPALGPRSANGCVAAGGSPTCFPVPSTNTQGCLPVPCPGDAAFDVIVTLGDIAGNVQRTVISNVTCFSTLPSVVIASPGSDAPTFTDPSKHLLASSAPQAFRDNAAATGAQTDIVACANRAGTIALFVGLKGDATLAALGVPKNTRMAVAGDLCPAGFHVAVTFAGVTLRESIEATDTSLLTPTELRVDLVDQSSTKNSSPLVDLWVDSVEPVLLITAPVDICNSYHQSNDVYLSSETVTSTAPFVDLALTNSSSTQNFSSTNFTSLMFPFVVFTQGQTTLAGTARDAAGNVSLLQPNPCTVTVGPNPP